MKYKSFDTATQKPPMYPRKLKIYPDSDPYPGACANELLGGVQGELKPCSFTPFQHLVDGKVFDEKSHLWSSKAWEIL